MDYAAVSQAVSRFGKRLEAQLRRTLTKLKALIVKYLEVTLTAIQI